MNSMKDQIQLIAKLVAEKESITSKLATEKDKVVAAGGNVRFCELWNLIQSVQSKLSEEIYAPALQLPDNIEAAGMIKASRRAARMLCRQYTVDPTPLIYPNKGYMSALSVELYNRFEEYCKGHYDGVQKERQVR